MPCRLMNLTNRMPDGEPLVIERWGAGLYGQPCRQCRFDWSITPEAALDYVRTAPQELIRRTAGAEGHERSVVDGVIVEDHQYHDQSAVPQN